MPSSPVHVSDSDSDEEVYSIYSGAAKRFKKTTAKTLKTGVVKLVSSPSAKHAKLARRSPTPERIDSSDEELFRPVNDSNREQEENNLDESLSIAKYTEVERLEEVDIEDSPVHVESFQRVHSSASVIEEVTFEDDPLGPLNNSSIDKFDEDETFVVKVRFINEKVWRIEIKRSDYFKLIAKELAEKTGTAESKIKLYHNDQPLDLYDTLRTIPLKITDIIDAAVAEEEEDDDSADTSGMLELKIQGQNKGAVVVVAIRPQDPMKVLMQKYADATATDVSKLVFNFDGEQLSPDDTPEMLDLEGGECIDVHIRK